MQMGITPKKKISGNVQAGEFERLSVEGNFHHCQAVDEWGDGTPALVRWIWGEQPQQAVELEPGLCRPAESQVTQVGRIKCPAEEINEHRKSTAHENRQRPRLEYRGRSL